MKTTLILVVTLIILTAGGLVYFNKPVEAPEGVETTQEVDDFTPEQIAEEGLEMEVTPATHPDIKLITPHNQEIVSSPITIKGEARGTWFFEASFPIVLTDSQGNVISEGFATTTEPEWMTENFIPFEAELEFDDSQLHNEGALILQKDNPSDDRTLDDSYEITVFFE